MSSNSVEDRGGFDPELMRSMMEAAEGREAEQKPKVKWLKFFNTTPKVRNYAMVGFAAVAAIGVAMIVMGGTVAAVPSVVLYLGIPVLLVGIVALILTLVSSSKEEPGAYVPRGCFDKMWDKLCCKKPEDETPPPTFYNPSESEDYDKGGDAVQDAWDRQADIQRWQPATREGARQPKLEKIYDSLLPTPQPGDELRINLSKDAHRNGVIKEYECKTCSLMQSKPAVPLLASSANRKMGFAKIPLIARVSRPNKRNLPSTIQAAIRGVEHENLEMRFIIYDDSNLSMKGEVQSRNLLYHAWAFQDDEQGYAPADTDTHVSMGIFEPTGSRVLVGANEDEMAHRLGYNELKDQSVKLVDKGDAKYSIAKNNARFTIDPKESLSSFYSVGMREDEDGVKKAVVTFSLVIHDKKKGFGKVVHQALQTEENKTFGDFCTAVKDGAQRETDKNIVRRMGLFLSWNPELDPPESSSSSSSSSSSAEG